MSKSLYIFLFLVTAVIKGQVLLPTTETAFEAQHHFNPLVIKKNGVKKITFEIIDKRDFEVAVDKNLVETYEFNSDGFITRYYYTTIVKTLEKHVAKYSPRGRPYQEVSTEYVYDTISTTYLYANNNLILKRYHDGVAYYEGRYYRYDKDGNKTKELRFKETNNSTDKSFFVLGNQLLLSEDSFQYQTYGAKQIKCLFLNNENRPYKEKITNFDENGLKKTISENYTAAAWIMQDQSFEYNKAGQLTMAKFDGNANNNVVLKNTYQYDDRGELYAEMQYKNDVLLREISYVSDKTNGLLNSFIIRDPSAKSLRIVKLKYDFGMVGKRD